MSAEDIKVRALSNVPLPNEGEFAVLFDSENNFKLTSKHHNGDIRIYCFEPCGGGVTLPITTAGDADITSTGGDMNLVANTGTNTVSGAVTVIAALTGAFSASGATSANVTTTGAGAEASMTTTDGDVRIEASGAGRTAIVQAVGNVTVKSTGGNAVLEAKGAGGKVTIDSSDLMTVKSILGDMNIEASAGFIDVFGVTGIAFGSNSTTTMYGTTISIGNNGTSGGVGITPNGDVTIFPDGGDIDLTVPAGKEILLDVSDLGSSLKMVGLSDDNSEDRVVSVGTLGQVFERIVYEELFTAITGDATGVFVTRNLGVANSGKIAHILICAMGANRMVMARSIGSPRTEVQIDGDGCLCIPVRVNSLGNIEISADNIAVTFKIVSYT